MTEKDLFREVGKIKDEYVVEAWEYKRSVIHNVVFQRSLVAAACLMVCFGLYWGTRQSEKAYEGTADANEVAMQDNAAVYGAEVQEEAAQVELETDAEMATEMENTAPSEQKSIAMCIPETAREVVEDKELENLQESVKEEVMSIVQQTEKLQNTEADVEVVHGKVELGQELWDGFVEKVSVLESAEIDIVQYTVEGAPIFTNLQFDGGIFKVTVDNTEDSFAGSSVGVKVSTYNYLNILQEENNVEVILSMEKDLTREQLYSEEYETYYLFQYNLVQ